MLSEAARSDSIPGLEIEADDVRCTHGATSGRVDEEQIFYAQARGLSADEAARLVVAGFFQQVFDRITIASVREALAAAIEAASVESLNPTEFLFTTLTKKHFSHVRNSFMPPILATSQTPGKCLSKLMEK